MGNWLTLEPSDAVKERIQAYTWSYQNKMTSYSSIASATSNKILERTKVSFKETIDFFWFFLYKFICPMTSKKPTDSLLPWAVVSASWFQEEHQDEFAFAQVILAQLCNKLSLVYESRLPFALESRLPSVLKYFLLAT